MKIRTIMLELLLPDDGKRNRGKKISLRKKKCSVPI